MLILAQSDTTVGYLSKSSQRINQAKNRSQDQKVLQTVASFKELQKLTRTPPKFRRMIRRAKKTTFVLDNGRSFRVVDKASLHHSLIRKMGSVYSSSANETKQAFHEATALAKSDIIVKDRRGFFEAEASTMYRLSRTRKKRLR
jgi:tRNA A37 threonylcarbamoyladenosine synthetase subunit TsaC/SUA5/YrdC